MLLMHLPKEPACSAGARTAVYRRQHALLTTLYHTAAAAQLHCRRTDAEASCVRRVQDFTSAVMDVDFSPTGREFVAGSYDRSVRIYAYNGGHSREVYTARRMQRVFAARFTGDGTYVVTGSDDFNLRIWKVRRCACCACCGSVWEHAEACDRPDAACLGMGVAPDCCRAWSRFFEGGAVVEMRGMRRLCCSPTFQ